MAIRLVADGGKPPTPDSLTVLIYGEPGRGKTTDVAWALKDKAVWINSEPGGLDTVYRTLGIRLGPIIETFDTTNPREDFSESVRMALDIVQKGQAKFVVIDTLTTITERLIKQLLGSYRDGRQAYGELDRFVKEKIDSVISTSVGLVVLAHSRDPEVDPKTGHFSRGGPRFAGKALTQNLPTRFGLVLLADVEKDDLTGTSRRVYRCDQTSTQWIMKDRYGVTLPVEDMEFLRILWRFAKGGNTPMPDEVKYKRIFTSATQVDSDELREKQVVVR